MARVKDIGEMTQRAAVFRRQFKRALERVFGAVEIARIAGLACLADERVAEPKVGLSILGITFEQLLVISDVIIGRAALGPKQVRVQADEQTRYRQT